MDRFKTQTQTKTSGCVKKRFIVVIAPQCQRPRWRWFTAYDKPLKASSSAFSPVISEEAFSHRQVTSRKVWGESITATVMFLLRDNHKLWPSSFSSSLACCKPFFSSFPLTFSLLTLLASAHLISLSLFLLPYTFVPSPPTLLLAPSCLSSRLSFTFLCLREVSEKTWNPKYQITFLDMGFNPSLFGHREAQFPTPTCNLDNYCERGGQQQQEKVHDYLYLGLQALQQKGEEIEEETKTDSWSCLGELRGDSVCVFLVVCVHVNHTPCASN